jgi:hypothetical protein
MTVIIRTSIAEAQKFRAAVLSYIAEHGSAKVAEIHQATGYRTQRHVGVMLSKMRDAGLLWSCIERTTTGTFAHFFDDPAKCREFEIAASARWAELRKAKAERDKACKRESQRRIYADRKAGKALKPGRVPWEVKRKAQKAYERAREEIANAQPVETERTRRVEGPNYPESRWHAEETMTPCFSAMPPGKYVFEPASCAARAAR